MEGLPNRADGVQGESELGASADRSSADWRKSRKAIVWYSTYAPEAQFGCNYSYFIGWTYYLLYPICRAENGYFFAEIQHNKRVEFCCWSGTWEPRYPIEFTFQRTEEQLDGKQWWQNWRIWRGLVGEGAGSHQLLKSIQKRRFQEIKNSC